MLVNLARSEAYFSGEINVAGRQKVIVDKTVNGTLTDHDRVFIVHTDMVYRLFFHDFR